MNLANYSAELNTNHFGNVHKKSILLYAFSFFCNIKNQCLPYRKKQL
jgi:hypothetical protein